MATDHSPPALKIIVVAAVVTVVSLIGLKFGFDSYFAFMTDEAAKEKIAPTEQLDKLKAEEQKNLTASPMPISAAMSDLAKSGRSDTAGPDLIAPKPSEDLGPLTGWTKNPRKFEVPPKPVAPELPVPAAGDAGAPSAADGGTPAATDAGAAPPADAGKPHAHDHHPAPPPG
ncbi:MAG: hypothetical protein JNL38_40345 [Myxococcales bacterium]|nr:hypothetical protein [Myxococcales bacterium]